MITENGDEEWSEPVQSYRERGGGLEMASGESEWTERVDRASGLSEWTERVKRASGGSEWMERASGENE
jgi:hypothetical protein